MRSGKVFDEQWVEVFSLFFVIVGFIIAIGLRNPLFSYITVFLCGALAARFFYQKRYKEPILPFVLIIVGFLLGYLTGGFWTSKWLNLIFFILGFAISYYLHQREIFVIFKSRGFVK